MGGALNSAATLEARRRRTARLFLLPLIAALLLVAAWPLARTFYFSFTDTSLNDLAGGEWIGFRNYLHWHELSSGRVVYRGLLVDGAWWNAVWNTFRLTFAAVSIEAFLGLLVAMLLNAEFRGRAIIRAAILIPWAIPTIVSARLWGWMLHDQFGILNEILLLAGLIDMPIAWTARPDTAMLAVLIVEVWKTTPFVALLCLAGLQMIPREVYEAARVDGVSRLRVFWGITLPLVRPALMVAIIFRALDTLRIFDLIYVLTPNSEATKTMSVIARENLIEFDRFAYGSAQSVLLFLLIAVATLLYIWLGRVDVGDEAAR